MKVHHLNCGTMRPFGGRLVSGTGSIFATAEMVCHCLLIETEQGLVLVDTGLGTHEVNDPKATLHGIFRNLFRPVLDISETAVHQVVKLGYAVSDVRHIVLTHLDLDHTGGLRDFPSATVHVLEDELQAALNPRTLDDRRRYPAVQREGSIFATHTATGESWFGFEAVRDIPGLPSDILLVPLIGHTNGHTGVAVRKDEGWLLHAGDSYFFHTEMDAAPTCPPMLKALQDRVQTIQEARLSNQDRLRSLVRAHSDEVEVFCAHDASELRRYLDSFSGSNSTLP